MAGFNDATLGSQRIGFAQGGVKMEMCAIDYSNDISSNANVIPTTLVKLLGWVGYATICTDAGCICGGQGKPITNMSICEGSYLGISIADITVATLTSEAKLNYLVWGW